MLLRVWVVFPAALVAGLGEAPTDLHSHLSEPAGAQGNAGVRSDGLSVQNGDINDRSRTAASVTAAKAVNLVAHDGAKIQTHARAGCEPMQVDWSLPRCGGPAWAPGDEFVTHCCISNRFCEVYEGGEVWVSFGCHDCPLQHYQGLPSPKGMWHAQMDTLGFQEAARADWLDSDGDQVVRIFNGERYTRFAELTSDSGGRLEEQRVRRSNIQKFLPGRQVYQITTASPRKVYTLFMNTGETQYSRNLLSLGNQIDLPDGWTYSCKVVGASGLSFESIGGFAHIMMDKFFNVYHLTDESQSACLYTEEECIQETDATYERFCRRNVNDNFGYCESWAQRCTGASAVPGALMLLGLILAH